MTVQHECISHLIFGDSRIELPKIPKESIDLIITSPTYEDIGGAGYKAKTKDRLFPTLYHEFLTQTFEEYFRILKPTGQIYFNVKSKTFNKEISTPHWIEFLEPVQKFKLKSLCWKYAGSFDSTDKRYHLDYEEIYHLSKTDDIYLNEKCGIEDPLTSVWYIPHNIPKNERLHPTQMPKKVVERILKVASKEGDVVLDNFMGVGTTGLVCKEMKRDFIGIELDPDNYHKAVERLQITQDMLAI